MPRMNRLLPALVAILLPAAAWAVPGYGTVSFSSSCNPAVQARLNTAIARMHDFDGPEQAFQDIATADPGCAIAWWGAAITVRGNPLAGAPGRAALRAGQAYTARARAMGRVSAREAGLIAAAERYFRNPAEPHAIRTEAYEAAMRALAMQYPDDPDIQSLHALAILETVDLTDTSLARQREAGSILARVWAANPGHPGAAHYLIHAYDYPALAPGALAAARAYAGIAPAAAHAQHMPSHIYSMLGLWADSVAANEAAATLEGAPHTMPGMDAQDPHGLDFITYARLQLGQDDAVAAALAAAGPSAERTIATARYLLERHDWPGARAMPARTLSAFDAITVRFTRALGAARSGSGDAAAARLEAGLLRTLRPTVLQYDGGYWAGLVDVYAEAADAWAAQAAGDNGTALRLMARAAAMDDAREKHILLENKLLPMRELYGDLLLELGQPGDALTAYVKSQGPAPNRFNGFLGVARAERMLGHEDAARLAYGQAAALVAGVAPRRTAILEAREGS